MCFRRWREFLSLDLSRKMLCLLEGDVRVAAWGEKFFPGTFRWETPLGGCVLSHSVVSARLLHPWDFQGKNTGVGCHFISYCNESSQLRDQTVDLDAGHASLASPALTGGFFTPSATWEAPLEDGLLVFLSLHFRVSPEPEWNLQHSRGEDLKAAGEWGLWEEGPRSQGQEDWTGGKPRRRTSRKDFGSEYTIS